MNEPKHTPGPWRHVLGSDYTSAVITGEGIGLECVAVVKSIGYQQADARLIAAAPELLEALKRCLDIMHNGGTWTLEDQNAAHAAIAKAEGAQP